MAVADYSTRIYSTGTSTLMTAEACTLSGGNTIAQVTSTSKRIIDYSAAMSLYDNAVLKASASYVINHLNGKATIASGSWTGPVTVTMNYLPLVELTECVSRGIDLTRDVLPKDVYSADSWRKRLVSLRKGVFDLKIIAAPRKDYDSGGGTVELEAILTAGTIKVLQFTFPSGLILRAWVLEGSINRKSEVAGRIEMDVTFESTGIFDVDLQNGNGFAFSDE